MVVPTSVYAATDDWGTTGDRLTDGLPGRIERAAGELAGLLAGRAPNGPAGGGAAQEEAVVPFEQQLAALRV